MAAVSTQTSRDTTELIWYLNLKLAALGQPTGGGAAEPSFLQIAQPLLRSYETKDRLLRDHLCPADSRIQTFLQSYLNGFEVPRLPARTLVLDRPGLARAMSLPPNSASFTSPFLRSYRVPQGILHNPSSDRRTTKGVFHIAEGGFPIPADKQPVPIQTFAALLRAALAPPADLLTLPFTADQEHQARLFVSLLIRPLVCPATGTDEMGNGAKTMEIRFFAPASLVSNLDFVESIFGNAGDPDLPENDAALDVMHWTGHTGCVILAPHLAGTLKKAELGEYLRNNREAFDLIVSADTLVYFGDLKGVIAAFAAALRPNGRLVFTLEHAAGDVADAGFRLELHGRYSHAQPYVEQLLTTLGLQSKVVQAELRMEAGAPVQGLVIGATMSV